MKVFTKITLAMSKANSPTSPMVIPCCHRMKVALTKTIESPSLNPALRAAAAFGLTKLEGYFNVILSNHLLVVATGESIFYLLLY